MLDRDPPGQRFLQLLDVHDEQAVDRGISEKALPFVGNVGAKIGDDRINRNVAVGGMGEPCPGHIGNFEEVVDRSERDHADTQPLLTLQLEIDDIVPEQAEREAGRKMDAAIVEAREEEDGKDEPVADREARQDMIGSADARIMGEAPEAVIAGDQGEAGRGERVLKAVEILGVIFELVADQEGNDHGQQQPDAQLQPRSLPQRPPRGREFASRDVHFGSALGLRVLRLRYEQKGWKVHLLAGNRGLNGRAGPGSGGDESLVGKGRARAAIEFAASFRLSGGEPSLGKHPWPSS